ncbi:MAG: hypothetical protein MZV65_32450 [Chromatiales bacterium]|nr:hypothetical protein [Chromatiales bacterium]
MTVIRPVSGKRQSRGGDGKAAHEGQRKAGLLNQARRERIEAARHELELIAGE